MLRSPCVGNCCLDDEDVCMGCGRKIDEIVGWADKSEAEQRQIIELSQARHQAYLERRDKSSSF